MKKKEKKEGNNDQPSTIINYHSKISPPSKSSHRSTTIESSPHSSRAYSPPPIPLHPEYKCLGAVVDSNSRRPINNERGFAARLPLERWK